MTPIHTPKKRLRAISGLRAASGVSGHSTMHVLILGVISSGSDAAFDPACVAELLGTADRSTESRSPSVSSSRS